MARIGPSTNVNSNAIVKIAQNCLTLMNQEINAIRHDVQQLSHHAHALLVATADIASEKVVVARDQLDAILNRTRNASEALYDGAADSARYCRDTIRKHPYESLAIGLVVGAVIGLLSVRSYISYHPRGR